MPTMAYRPSSERSPADMIDAVIHPFAEGRTYGLCELLGPCICANPGVALIAIAATRLLTADNRMRVLL
jgi:hypothetical protein